MLESTYPRMASHLTAGVPSGTTTVHGSWHSAAAQATAWVWRCTKDQTSVYNVDSTYRNYDQPQHLLPCQSTDRGPPTCPWLPLLWVTTLATSSPRSTQLLMALSAPRA